MSSDFERLSSLDFLFPTFSMMMSLIVLDFQLNSPNRSNCLSESSKRTCTNKAILGSAYRIEILRYLRRYDWNLWRSEFREEYPSEQPGREETVRCQS